MYFAPGREGFGLSTGSILVDLTEGNHTLEAYSLDANGREMSTSETFTVDTNFRYPKISFISPQNQTYNKNEVPLTFTIDAQIERAYYTLDIFGNKSFSGNITLNGLSEGPHRILVSARTERGYASQIISFNINTTQANNPLIIENQILPVAIAIISISLTAVMAVIFYKRKNLKGTN